jgi:hypothetical protein
LLAMTRLVFSKNTSVRIVLPNPISSPRIQPRWCHEQKCSLFIPSTCPHGHCDVYIDTFAYSRGRIWRTARDAACLATANQEFAQIAALPGTAGRRVEGASGGWRERQAARALKRYAAYISDAS